MKKTLTIFPAIIITALICGGCTQTKVETTPDGNSSGNSVKSPIACTMEAKICPDGSAVGRSGPNCEFAECPTSSTKPATPDKTITTIVSEPVAVPNPASLNCKNQGGKLEIRKNKLGEYGVCIFEDNRQCEEWALFRGDCPVGGLKITGYENDAQIYCAITGGKLEGVGTDSPMCRKIDGTLCTVQANYDGQCISVIDPKQTL